MPLPLPLPLPRLPAVATAALLAAGWLGGCSGDAEDLPRPAEPAQNQPEPPAPPADWARAVGPADASPRRGPHREITPATLADNAYAADTQERVRRLVYRVSFVIPPSFRHTRRAIRPVSGELHLDVGDERLRATFVGPGWPIHDGAQIRLRADVPGVYVFDGDGGRWLGPGQMAMWFEGKPVGTVRSSVRIRREFGKLDPDGPGALVCALLAEWTNQPRELLEPRCRGGSLPPGFRFGPWRAEVTAVVPLSLPRRVLRADETDPPLPIEALRGAPVLAAAERARLEPRRPELAAPLQSLQLVNESATRLIVIAQGIPVAWLDAGERLSLDGLTPGLYRVGAIRPFGLLNQVPRPQSVPGELVFGRGISAWSAPAPGDDADPPHSPSPSPGPLPGPSPGQPPSPASNPAPTQPSAQPAAKRPSVPSPALPAARVTR